MNNVVFINNQEVVFFENKDEQVFCTSLDVAKVFGKNHFHVLRDIENILNNLRKIGTSQDLSNFGLIKYKDKKGELKTKRKFKSNNLHSKQYNLCFAR